MAHMGAELTELARGSCTLAVDRRPELLQQHGLFHGGVTAFLVDNATTIAAAASRGQPVLTAEYKLNSAVAGVGPTPDLPGAGDQARTTGRGRRRGCVLRDRRRRKTHRDRIGLDRDAREAAGNESQARPDRPGLSHSCRLRRDAQVRRACVTFPTPLRPRAPRRGGLRDRRTRRPRRALRRRHPGLPDGSRCPRRD